MEWATVMCPACWQKQEVEVEMAAEEHVEMITDCEVCCRPMALNCWRGPDGDLQAEAEPGND
jgi:hypothetical protein